MLKTWQPYKVTYIIAVTFYSTNPKILTPNRETHGISRLKTQWVSQMPYVLWGPHQEPALLPWLLKILRMPQLIACPLFALVDLCHLVPSHILCNHWKKFTILPLHTLLCPTSLVPHTWLSLETLLWQKCQPCLQRKLVVDQWPKVTRPPGSRMMEMVPGCLMRLEGLFDWSTYGTNLPQIQQPKERSLSAQEDKKKFSWKALTKWRTICLVFMYFLCISISVVVLFCTLLA